MNEASRKTSSSESLHERLARDGADSLTVPERRFLAVEEFDVQLFASGFEEYFLGLTQAQLTLLIGALAAVGAVKTRELVEAAATTRSLARSTEQAPADFLSSAAGRHFGRLVSQLQEYPDHLRKLGEAFAEHNAKDFLGPKTQLELWRSRRDRGEPTAAKRVTVALSKEAEAQRDAAISTRSCPECGYPSPDYRRTCKSCGFPHGATDERMTPNTSPERTREG